MPVYIRITDIRGDVTPAGAGSGGVWRTTNFLSAAPVGRAAREPGLPGVTVFLDQNSSSGVNARPKIKTFLCPSDGSAVEVSRISLVPGVGGVEGRDPAARMKVEQLINTARSQGPQGKLYLATDQGVYRSGSNKFNGSHNLKQIGIGVHNTASVEIIVTDLSGNVTGEYRFERATVSRHPGGINVGLCDGSVR